MAEVRLTPSGERALREAQNLCFQTNVAIVAPEHLLAGALIALRAEGLDALPAAPAITAAAVATQGEGSQPLADNVMFGSSARDAINAVAADAGATGHPDIDARALAAGTVQSGEVNPMFFSTLGLSRQALLDLLVPGTA